MRAVEYLSSRYDELEKEIKLYPDYVSEKMRSTVNNLYDFVKNAPKNIKDAVAIEVHNMIDINKPYVSVYLYSFILNVKKDSMVLKEFCRFVLGRKEFYANTKYFLYYQIKSLMFNFKGLEDSETLYLKWELLREAVFEFKKEINVSYEKVPGSERNENLVIVLTEQILTPQHAPTMIAFDRCKIILEKLGKQVVLINTAEVLSQIGYVDFLNCLGGNYRADLKEVAEQEWKGVKIPYLQCDDNMPDIDAVGMLLEQIRSMKPGLIVSIGGSGMLANLVNNIIPVLTVSLVPSDIESTMTKYQTIGRELNDNDREILDKMGIPYSSVVSGVFTSSMLEQKEHMSRKDMKIPENKFILTILGSRLDEEITSEYGEMLENALEDDMHMLFVGKFDTYSTFVEAYPKLKKNSTYAGFSNDILATLEQCDLYVNVIRKGGGTSGVAALFKGVPVVTTEYGDIATNAGNEFVTDSYETMALLIKKYKNDKEFYKLQSQKAIERSEILQDTEGQFVKIINEVLRREKGYQ